MPKKYFALIIFVFISALLLPGQHSELSSEKGDTNSDPSSNVSVSNKPDSNNTASFTLVKPNIKPSLQTPSNLPPSVHKAYSHLSVTKTENSIITKDGKVYPLRTYKTLITPNDPDYNQWWVPTNGMTNVWDIPSGDYQTKIAVIDTGFALNHEELTGRWAINNSENGLAETESESLLNCTDKSIPLSKSCNLIDDNYDAIVDNESGVTTKENPSKLNCTDQSLALDKSCNNIDDDDNGLVDDYRGWDFSYYDASPQAGQVNPSGTGTAHGTAVAGVLGASGNNGVGIAGVNWHTEILPIQALDDDGYGDSYTVGEAVYYAADQGADIISMSLGTEFDDPYLRLAILYALDKGTLVVAASGNDGCDCISYPANYPEVVAVGAINPSGDPALFSNYGSNLDILAPGQSIATSVYSSSNQTSAYTTASGTSFATPFVSGLLGLGKMSQPSAKWEEIIGSMFEESDRRTLTIASPKSNILGYGVVKSDSMLSRLASPPSVVQRYGLSGGTILGSTMLYQCQNKIPATAYYQLKKSGVYKYTANLRELSKATQQGWSYQQVGSFCIGLADDLVDTLRLIDLPKETLNIQIKQ